MVTREEHEEAKRGLSKIRHKLATEQLSEQERHELEMHAAGLSGVIMSPWVPFDWGRRLIMLAVFIIGLSQASIGHSRGLLWWLLLPLFSPRIVGLTAHALGRLDGTLGG